MSGWRPGPLSWEDLVKTKLSGSTLTAVIHGALINEGFDGLELVEGSKNRFRFSLRGEEIHSLPLAPSRGPLYDEDKPCQLAFAVGMAGEGYILLPRPVDELVREATA